MNEIEKTNLSFGEREPEKKREKKYNPCSICGRPIWHSMAGRYSRVCGQVCDLSRTFLGGGRPLEEVWELLRKHKLSEWESMEAWWRDMGHSHFPSAFLLRRDRGAKHCKENSFWAPYPQAKRVHTELAGEKKKKRVLPNGRTVGDCCEPYGINIYLFQRMCGGIAKKYGLTMNQVMEEFGMAPPPSPDWKDSISVHHQGQEYSIRRISKESGISFLSLYWRWMKGMFLIDDDIAHRLARTRSRRDARAKQIERWNADYKPFNEG